MGRRVTGAPKQIDWSRLDPSATAQENAERLGATVNAVRHHARRQGVPLQYLKPPPSRKIDWSRLDPSATARENAARLGTSADVVRAHVHRRGLVLRSGAPEVRHGTSRMYDYHACRCAPCVRFSRERNRKFREGTLVPPGLAERLASLVTDGGLSLNEAAVREGVSRRTVGQLVVFVDGACVVRPRPRPKLVMTMTARENAEHLGLTVGQVKYAARRSGVRLSSGRLGRPPCGTVSRYKGGCRCAPCKGANAEQVRQARARKKKRIE